MGLAKEPKNASETYCFPTGGESLFIKGPVTIDTCQSPAMGFENHQGGL